MGKLGAVKKGEAKIYVNFNPVVKEIGEGDNKTVFSLKYDKETERFDFRKNQQLLVSSCNIKPCLLSAENNGVTLTDEEKKVSLSTKE